MTAAAGAGPDPGPVPEHVPNGVRTMAVVRWALVLAMGVVAALSIAYAAGALHRGGAGAAHARLYHCPMHPAIVQDHPGECPICGMTLVLDEPARASTSAAPPVTTSPVPGLVPLELPTDRVQLIGMRTAQVERAPLSSTLRAVGVIAPSERGLAQISARFSGWIQTLAVPETGRRVARGEVLATIYSPDVVAAEQEFLTARGWTAEAAGAAADPHGGGAHVDLEAAARHRLELLGVAAPEIDALAARGKVGDAVPIRSPVAGTVTARNVVAGAAVAPGQPLFEVADLSRVWLLAEVFEQDAGRLRLGQKATLELAAYPGERFAGKVQFIYPTLSADTRTLRVRLEFPNRKGPGGPELRPGMYGDVAFELASATSLVVPAEALVDTGRRQYVFVARGGGRFEPRLVHVGARAGERVQITDGVAEGETVVTTGNFLLDSESRLRAAIEGRAAPAAPGGSGIDRGR
jgi:Cu(I)/Ag(I) efflux system membrane fusion protein